MKFTAVLILVTGLVLLFPLIKRAVVWSLAAVIFTLSRIPITNAIMEFILSNWKLSLGILLVVVGFILWMCV